MSGNRFDMVAMAFLIAGMQLVLSVCCTSYTFSRVICALFVLSVVQWHLPFAVVRVDNGRCEGVIYDGDAVLAVGDVRVSW